MSSSLCIVVVHYHTPDLLRRCLEALRDAPWPILVVDNGRTLRQEDLASASLIVPPSNLGYGRAVNLAAARSQTDWVLALNADVLLAADAIDSLLQAAIAHDAVLAAPQLFLDEGRTFASPPATGWTPQWDAHLAGRLSSARAWQAAEQADLKRHMDHFALTEPRRTTYLSGACLLIRSQWFRRRQEPIFDPDFFLYFEDTDLCTRVATAAATALYVPSVRGVHHWDRSPAPPRGSKAQVFEEAAGRYRRKHFPHHVPAAVEAGVEPPSYAPCRSSEVAVQGIGYVDVSIEPGFSLFASAPVSRGALNVLSDLAARASTPLYARLRDHDGRIICHHTLVD